MSYQEKYFKYKNKYLDLKSKLSEMQVNPSGFLNNKDNNLIGGATITEKTENTHSESESDSISSLFIQTGGREKQVNVKSKQMKASKQFIQNDSDLISSSTLDSSNTISNNTDSDFLSE
jgi:hypothetical protein